ncbi:hypothetical protein M8A51_18150 [Schlegelella sp. S2-27]|uniref:DUF2489 domain-containing protein n=1 Tax=Caldimonas mangrovi TaxID=2944811 RepID=A0ABT0YT16_9BURK|nr:hypothetical protein [Caldimonas mangrovi]MCM5681454.1 hypothetical protein [Caldimonas mangrovi]
MSVSTATPPLPLAPRRQSLSTGERLNAELLLNRLAMQLEQVRYLASAGVDAQALRHVVVMLKMAHGLAFRDPALWAWLARPRVVTHAGAPRNAPEEPFDAACLADADPAGLGRATELIDEAAARLTHLGDALHAKDAPQPWYD